MALQGIPRTTGKVSKSVFSAVPLHKEGKQDCHASMMSWDHTKWRKREPCMPQRGSHCAKWGGNAMCTFMVRIDSKLQRQGHVTEVLKQPILGRSSDLHTGLCPNAVF